MTDVLPPRNNLNPLHLLGRLLPDEGISAGWIVGALCIVALAVLLVLGGYAIGSYASNGKIATLQAERDNAVALREKSFYEGAYSVCTVFGTAAHDDPVRILSLCNELADKMHELGLDKQPPEGFDW